MRLILTLQIETEENWSTLTQEALNKMVYEGFKSNSAFLVDYRRISLNIFTRNSSITEIAATLKSSSWDSSAKTSSGKKRDTS